MTKILIDEATVKLALEALEYIEHNYMSLPAPAEKAITALREALNAPLAEQKSGIKQVIELYDSPEKPAPVAKPHEQEPVGYVAENGVVDWNICAPPIMTDLYTSLPAQRTWVHATEWRGLTDEEIDELSRTMVKGNKSVNWLCRAIEAKLRSKNENSD